MMPYKDGFTLAKEIREKNDAVPLIFLTAKTLKEDVLKGFKLGADDYISKPFDSEVLLAKANLAVNNLLKDVTKKFDADKAVAQLGMSLAKLAEEDPTFQVKTDEASGQTIISGMGELHLNDD